VAIVLVKFREAKQKIRKPAARLAETEAAHEHGIEPAARRDERQRRGIQRQQAVADGGDPQHVDEAEGHAELAAGEHGAGEEGETEQHHGNRQQALARMLGRFAEGEFGG